MITWPQVAKDYLERYHQDPVKVCPVFEEKAQRHADVLLPVIAGLGVAPQRMIDIGCGLALIDVHLVRAFPTLRAVWLLDGDGSVAKQPVGFRQDTQAWADARVAVEIVRDNVADDVAVGPLAPAPFGIMVDLIISCRSWCHHYPADVYLRSVMHSLSPKGLVVVDIRQGTDGRAQLEAAGLVAVAQVPDDSVKCSRLVFARKGL